MKKLLPVLFFFLSIASLSAAEGGVSTYPYKICEVFGIPITNSMITTWLFAIATIILVRFAVGRPSLIPSKGQAFFETVYEGIQSVVKPIVGHKMLPKTLPILLCLFIFILINNWTGLLPFVGTAGIRDSSGHLIYFIRPANSDLNTTVALSIVSLLAWAYFVLRYAGIKAFIYDIFGNKADKKKTPLLLYLFLSFVFLLVGVIEMISIGIRPITLAMRLFGNVLGGETLLATMTSMTQWYIPVAVPFYLLETLVGLIQATVFVLLTAVYIGLICNHEEEH